MSSEPARDSKPYRTAAILFVISGIIFVILTVVGIYFLPVGIALVILSIAFWQLGKGLINS